MYNICLLCEITLTKSSCISSMTGGVPTEWAQRPGDVCNVRGDFTASAATVVREPTGGQLYPPLHHSHERRVYNHTQVRS